VKTADPVAQAAGDIADRVARRRHELDWSLETVSRRSGVNLSHVWRIERGEANASLKTLAKVAAALGMRVVFTSEEP
jgi:transcriptional regulator with XRE-family HTH domain